MELSETPKKKAPIVPGGYILVNEKWKGSTFEKCLSGVGKAIYCDNLGAIDFYPSDHCPIIYINEGELLSGITYERKLEKMRKVSNTGGIIIADRNNFTIKHFSDLQDKCFAMDLILIPIGNVSELPQILTQMAYMESKSPTNPFKVREKTREGLPEQQFKLFTLIPGVGEKKARILLNHFGHPHSLATIPEESFISKLTPLIGETSAKNVYNFYFGRIECT